jgi:hypothetical protein
VTDLDQVRISLSSPTGFLARQPRSYACSP